MCMVFVSADFVRFYILVSIMFFFEVWRLRGQGEVGERSGKGRGEVGERSGSDLGAYFHICF